MFRVPLQYNSGKLTRWMTIILLRVCPMFRTPLQLHVPRELAGWQLHVPCWQNSKHFHFRSIKSYSTIPLFRIPRFTASRHYANFYLIVLKNVSLVTYYLPGSRVWYAVDHWEYRSISQGDLRLIQSKSIGRPI